MSLNTKCSCGEEGREGERWGGREGIDHRSQRQRSQCQIGKLIWREEGWCMGVGARVSETQKEYRCQYTVQLASGLLIVHISISIRMSDFSKFTAQWYLLETATPVRRSSWALLVRTLIILRAPSEGIRQPFKQLPPSCKWSPGDQALATECSTGRFPAWHNRYRWWWYGPHHTGNGEIGPGSSFI